MIALDNKGQEDKRLSKKTTLYLIKKKGIRQVRYFLSVDVFGIVTSKELSL